MSEASPRPWRVEENSLGWKTCIVDANGNDVASCWGGEGINSAEPAQADAALIVAAVNERAKFEAAHMEFPDLRPVLIAAGQRDAAIDERDRLLDALNEVCSRVSVALNCPRHETEAIDLLVHDLLGIKECASAAIGEDAP